MNSCFALCGSVKPYFARSIPCASSVVEVPAAHMAAHETTDELVPFALPCGLSRDALRQVVRDNGWIMKEDDDSCDVAVSIGTDRSQIVSVRFDQHEESGRPIVLYNSCCGPATRKNAMALLRRNARMVETAFAVEKRAIGDLFVLRGVHHADTEGQTEMAKMIARMARYADNVENKLTVDDLY